MTNYKLLLSTVALASSLFAIPALAQNLTQAPIRPSSMVGATDMAARQVLKAEGWTLVRHASTGTRTWSDWIDSDQARKFTLEMLDGRVIGANDGQPAAPSADQRLEDEHPRTD